LGINGGVVRAIKDGADDDGNAEIDGEFGGKGIVCPGDN